MAIRIRMQDEYKNRNNSSTRINSGTSLFQTEVSETMNGKNRSDVYSGLEVDIVLKKDQRTGVTTRGVVKDLLTNSSSHPHGIKVRLTDGQIGRVCQTYPK